MRGVPPACQSWHLRRNRVKCATFKIRPHAETRMIEANLTHLKIKDFTARTDILRGYL
jgi:hypothetical protein